MEREVLQQFLRSGPARKFDVCSITRRICAKGQNQDNLIFLSSYLNTCILFKCVSFDNSSLFDKDKLIDMLVYLPYDHHKPGDGGESFLFDEDNYWQFFTNKFRRENVDIGLLHADYAKLLIFDSVPTFSPFILELAFERANQRIPQYYLDLPPELRAKLREHIKVRIRPLIVEAFRNTGNDTENIVEDMIGRLFCLRETEKLLPLIAALRIREEEAVTLLSAWIGITYFEYEYSIIQHNMKSFVGWLNDFSLPREELPLHEKRKIENLVKDLRRQMRMEWGAMLSIWGEYTKSYEAYVFRQEVEVFSLFLRKCNSHYWRLADFLGKLEQTLLTWHHFTRNYHNIPLPYSRIMELYSILNRLHMNGQSQQSLPGKTLDGSLFSESRSAP